MYSFVVVAARPGRGVPSAMVELLRQRQPADLPFTAAHHVVWHADGERVWVAAWQEEDRLGLGVRWALRPSGITAFGGLPWFPATAWSTAAPWAEQLADRFADRPLATMASELEGTFTALSVGADGSGCVTSDPMGVSLLTRGEDADVVVASSRGALTARLLARGRPPARDAEAAAWLVYGSTHADDRTGFRGVRRVPDGSVLALGPDHPLVVTTWDRTPWLRPPDPAFGLVEAADEVSRHVGDLLEAASTMPSRRREFELTGGRDSRLLLALAVDRGLTNRFSYLTWGGPDLPDVVTAIELAEAFQLDLWLSHTAAHREPWHRPQPVPGPVPAADAVRTPLPPPTYEQALRHHVWATSGARSLWDHVRPGLSPSPSASVCGVFGELYRTYWASARELRTPDDLRAFAGAGGLHGDPLDVLLPDVRAHHEARAVETVLGLFDDSPDGMLQALDGHYLQTRLRNWVGTGIEHDNRNRVYPYASMTAIRAAFALPREARVGQHLGFEIVRRCDDRLARIGLAGTGWPAPTVAGLDGYPSSPLPAPFTPTPRPHGHRAARQWATAHVHRLVGSLRPEATRPAPRRADIVVDRKRQEELAQHLPLLRSLVDLGPGHQLFDVVDRRAVLRALEPSAVAHYGYYGRRAVLDIVTAATWLDGGEAPYRPDGA